MLNTGIQMHDNDLLKRFRTMIYLVSLCMMFSLACIAIHPSLGYAQESVDELEKNVNASGKSRTSDASRVSAEVGMGALGAVASVGVSAGLGLLGAAGLGLGGMIFGFGMYYLGTPAMAAGGTYLGGWMTGGRSKLWAPFAGGYIGAIPAYAVIISAYCVREHRPILNLVGSIALPVFSIVGAVIGYELSEKKETERLRNKRDALERVTAEQKSAPIMIQLYSGRF